jgi:uncharacterized membrane protein
MIPTPRYLLALPILLVVAVMLVYVPGLDGPFVFDDWATLPQLGASGPIHDVASFIRYVTSGTSDPTGRPLALVSFVMNARDWPADPLAFKITNLAIHLVNALLLGVLLIHLGRHLPLSPARRAQAAWFAAALWALHPFLVSTVLYVVQREAMLVTTFAFVALILWLKGRESLERGDRPAAVRHYAIAAASVGLALLCKANAVVIPLLALVIELTLPPLPEGVRPGYRRFVRVALVLPSVILLAVLAWLALAAIGQPPLAQRGWTVGDRLLTEPSILLDYGARLWLLRPAGGAFFHDQISATTSVLDLWRVAVPMLSCVGMVGVAILWRRRFAAVAGAVLFFFAGHALESSSIPLELYFEHRNYLPSALMFWPLALAIVGAPYPWLRRGLPPLLLAGFAWLTYTQATLWGDQVAQADVWARLQPDSPRAQSNAAGIDLSTGRLAVALQRISSARARFDDEPQVAINLIDIHCALGRVTADDVGYATRAFAGARRDPGALVTHWFEERIGSLSRPMCRGLDATVLRSLLRALESNPRVEALPGRRQDVAHLAGAIALSQGDSAGAARLFAKALSEEPTPKVALNEAALLGRAGRPDLGLRQLALLDALPTAAGPSWRDPMAWIHARILERQRFWPNEVDHLRGVLTTADRQRSAVLSSHGDAR